MGARWGNGKDNDDNSNNDPIARMLWGLESDNRRRYPGRLKEVLDYFGLIKPKDKDKESLRQAAVEFIEIVKQKPEWVEGKLTDFITYQHQRVATGEIKPITIKNYYKAVNRFCKMNRIWRSIEWTLISKGLPSGRVRPKDRAPTAEEFRKMIGEDLRLKVIICIMISSGAWDYVKMKHIMPIRKGDVT